MKSEETVEIEKLVHGGQGIGNLTDGRKVFVWNALPGEKVKVCLSKSKKSYAEGTATEIIAPSKHRIEPVEANYLATSPWQILDFDRENYWKTEIIKELFTSAKVKLPDFELKTDGVQYNYRNKMEYSFWGDDSGLHLALYSRGSHNKQIVNGSKLAIKEIDTAAKEFLEELSSKGVRAGDLKTLILRCNQKGQTVASLFVKTQEFIKISLPKSAKGIRVYYSNPKSPASVRTELLYELGDCVISDKLDGLEFCYDVDSFFQVNVPAFELALSSMRSHVDSDYLLDMYSGVGTIGLSLAKNKTDLVELDPATAAMAEVNAKQSNLESKVFEVASEKAIEQISAEKTVIFDPPRAGLHATVVDKILEVLPAKIIYLSCNPATHARDLSILNDLYKISFFEAYNFFPRTPHIETLAIMEKR